VARRARKDPEPSLFSFLSVLKAVMGTLTLIICGMSHLAFANPKQRVELEAFKPGKKQPIVVECREDGILIHPQEGGTSSPAFVSRTDLDAGDSEWGVLRRSLEHDAQHYLMLLVRADGIRTFHAARASLGDSPVEVAYEPIFGTGDVQLRERVALQ
jgi:hypothetical protein